LRVQDTASFPSSAGKNELNHSPDRKKPYQMPRQQVKRPKPSV
jgi:hypothetical protein